LLIIFDLDDTLIDTTDSLSFPRMKRAFNHLCCHGFFSNNPQEALDNLEKHHQAASSSAEAWEKWGVLYQLPRSWLHWGVQEIYNSSLDDPIERSEGASEVLQELSQQHTLALVTAGEEVHQRKKLEKAGLDSTSFSKIIVCGKGDKGIHYQRLAQEMRFLPKESVVCGDRIFEDLSPAKALHFHTIRVLKGRGLRLRPQDREEDVDFCISQLAEVITIINGLNYGRK
jgi:putative hydrolase of the HAD superfamily